MLLYIGGETIWYLIFIFGQSILVGYSGGRSGISGHSRMYCVQNWKKERFQRHRARIITDLDSKTKMNSRI